MGAPDRPARDPRTLVKGPVGLSRLEGRAVRRGRFFRAMDRQTSDPVKAEPNLVGADRSVIGRCSGQIVTPLLRDAPFPRERS